MHGNSLARVTLALRLPNPIKKNMGRGCSSEVLKTTPKILGVVFKITRGTKIRFCGRGLKFVSPL